VKEWVSELNERGLEPSIDVIEEVENLDDLVGRENYWILKYKEINPELFNESVSNSITIHSLNYDWSDFDIFLKHLEDVPSLIKSIRVKKGWSQTELADKVGIDRTTLWKLETDKDYNVTIHILKKIVKYGCRGDQGGFGGL